MRYINTQTGATIETDCAISGGNWVEQAAEKKQPKSNAKAEKQPATHTADSAVSL